MSEISFIVFQNASERVNGLAGEIDSLETFREQLSDTISPMDMKGINQRVWLLRQQHTDIGHQLEMLAYHLEERLQLSDIFNKRYCIFNVIPYF